MNYMKIHFDVLKDHIESCRIINQEYIILKEKIDKNIKKLYKFPYSSVKIVMISKLEKYIHELMRQSREEESNSTDAFEIYNIKYNSVVMYQAVVEGLNWILQEISKKESLFDNDIKTKEKFHENLNKCFTKTLEPKEWVKLINNLKSLNLIIDEIKTEEIKVNNENNRILFKYKNIFDYKKKRIGNLRTYNFQQMQHHDFMQKELNDTIDIDEINIDDILEPKNDSENFKLKVDFESKEFLYVLQECGKEFSYQIEQMYKNNLIDPESVEQKIKKRKTELTATYDDAIKFYFSIKSIAVLYYVAVKYYFEKNDKIPQIPFLGIKKDGLYNLTRPIFLVMSKNNLEKKKFNELVNLFAFGSDDVFDLYYKPLIFDNDQHIKIVPSLFENNNFSRTFLNHMNLINASFKKGWIFEEYIKKGFQKNGFKVYDKKSPGLNFELDSNKKGDIDILMQNGKYIFYGQFKNRAQPLERKDYKSFDRKINKKAIKQLKYGKEFLKSNPDYIVDFFEVDDINNYKLIPFIVTNSFYGSGEKREGISIIDKSALEIFFRGYIAIHDENEVIFKKSLLDKDKSLGQNFNHFLEVPYFLDEKLYPNLFFNKFDVINGKEIMLGFSKEFQKEHFKNCYINQLI